MAEMQPAEVPQDLWAAFDAGEDACWNVEGHDANWMECCRRTGLAAALKLHEQQLRERTAAHIDTAVRAGMVLGLEDAELYGAPGIERINEWADWIRDQVLGVVEGSSEDGSKEAGER